MLMKEVTPACIFFNPLAPSPALWHITPMKCLILALLFTAISANANVDLDSFIQTSIVHENQDVKTQMPSELKRALKKIFKTKFGAKIKNHMQATNQKLTLSKTIGEDADFSALEETIYYTLDVESWYQNHLEFIPPAANLDIATLDILLAHEIGHTKIGREVMGLAKLNSFLYSQANDGGMVLVFSRKIVQEEELRTTHFFENAYRSEIQVPLRYSYYEAYDVSEYGDNLEQ